MVPLSAHPAWEPQWYHSQPTLPGSHSSSYHSARAPCTGVASYHIRILALGSPYNQLLSNETGSGCNQWAPRGQWVSAVLAAFSCKNTYLVQLQVQGSGRWHVITAIKGRDMFAFLLLLHLVPETAELGSGRQP